MIHKEVNSHGMNTAKRSYSTIERHTCYTVTGENVATSIKRIFAICPELIGPKGQGIIGSPVRLSAAAAILPFISCLTKNINIHLECKFSVTLSIH